MVDLVAARRQQWEVLRASVLNPPTTSPLVHTRHAKENVGEGEGEGEGKGEEPIGESIDSI